MRGKKTSPEVTEAIHALRLAYGPAAIAEKTHTPLRTVVAVLARTDSPAVGSQADLSTITSMMSRNRRARR